MSEMSDVINKVRPVVGFLTRRTVVLLLGACIGYAYGYRHADMGRQSIMRSALSIIGVDAVQDDHVRRQRQIEAFRQARADSIESAIHR